MNGLGGCCDYLCKSGRLLCTVATDEWKNAVPDSGVQTAWGWCGTASGLCCLAIRAMQGHRGGGQHERWGGLPWQSERSNGVQRVHAITGRRVHFDPLSMPAALGDVTNTCSTSRDAQMRAFGRGGDAGQGIQPCGGHGRRGGLQVDMRINGGAFSKVQQVRPEAEVRSDIIGEGRSADLEAPAVAASPEHRRSPVRCDVEQGQQGSHRGQPASRFLVNGRLGSGVMPKWLQPWRQ